MNWKQLQNGSDIRGVALEGVLDEAVNLTPERVTILGQSFATWLSQQLNTAPTQLTISVGRDSRLSGPTLMAALIDGLTLMGCRVYDFSLASTPAMFMSTVNPDTACDGAIMMTASHLPFNRNGLKFFTTQGGLDKKDIAALLSLAEQNSFTPASASGSNSDSDKDSQNNDTAQDNGTTQNNNNGIVTSLDFISIYAAGFVQQIRNAVNHPSQFKQPLKGLRILVDAGNGAGGFYAEKVLKPLGADTTGSQFLDPDGTFPNHSPNPENEVAIAALRGAVLANNADFGIIFDTDVDRAAAVDAKGNELNRNRLIALIAAVVLQEHPGSTIVTDSITSDGLTQFIEHDLNGIHHRFKRGYKNVINESKRLNQEGQESWLAIETSGHGAMKENYFLDDGAYLITKLLVELAKANLEGRSLTDLISPLKEPIESIELRLKIGAEDFKAYGNQVIDALKILTEAETDWTLVPKNYEGVRIACPATDEEGWWLLRLSLHDPVIPINIESNVAGGVTKIATRLKTMLLKWDALDLSPFSAL